MGCCCKSRPYLGAVLALGLLGLAFHLVGFVAPGWIVFERTISITEISSERAEAMMMMQETEGHSQLIDNGGLRAPDMEENDNTVTDGDHEPPHHPGPHGDRHPHHHRPHGSHPEPHHEPHHRDDDDSMDNSNMESEEDDFKTESAMFEEWTQEIMIKTDTMKVRLSYGMMFSLVCVGKPHGDKKRGHHDDSSSEDDDDKRHGHHHTCKKISTRCAMAYSYLFQDTTGKSRRVSPNYVAHASLKEHKAELSVALALFVVGVIAGIIAFRNREGPRCAAVICLVALFVGFVLVSVPVARFSHFNRHRSRCNDGVEVHCPYSVVASGIGAVFMMAAMLVAGCGLCSKSRKERPGRWYQFNNEVVEEKKVKEKQPSLVFISEPLPEKAGLYDICNFDNLKPVETTQEPEKTPLE